MKFKLCIFLDCFIYLFILSRIYYVSEKMQVIYLVNYMFCLCSVMNLLAEIYSQEKMIPTMLGASFVGEKLDTEMINVVSRGTARELTNLPENPYTLSTLAPRLWPFMRHSITSVRYSAIRTLVSIFLLP